jgi:hypothetical protein
MALPVTPSLIGGGSPSKTLFSTTNDIINDVSGSPSSAPLTPPPPPSPHSSGLSQTTSTPNLAPYSNKFDDVYDQGLNTLQELLAKKQGIDPDMLAISRGFFKPTKTGSFSESLGNVAEEYGASQREQQKNDVSNVQARMALAKAGSEREREKASEGLMGKLYKNGEQGLEMDPEVAMKLASILKDPKFLQQAQTEQRQRALSKAGNELITTTQFTKPDGTSETKFKINPAKFGDYVKLTGDPLLASEKLADAIKKMRSSGMINDMGDTSNPFEILKLTAELLGDKGKGFLGLIDHYSKNYSKMDPEVADKKATELNQQISQHLDRNQQMANAMMISTSNQAIASSQHAFANQMRQSELDRKIEEAKLRRDEKETLRLEKLNAQATPLKDLYTTAENLRNHPGRGTGTTPFIGGVLQQIPTLEARDFGNELKHLKSETFIASVKNMAGLGSLSNAEGDKIANLIATLDPQGSRKAFDASLDTINRFVKNGMENINRQGRGEPPQFIEPDQLGKPTSAPSAPTPTGAPKRKVYIPGKGLVEQ